MGDVKCAGRIAIAKRYCARSSTLRRRG